MTGSRWIWSGVLAGAVVVAPWALQAEDEKKACCMMKEEGGGAGGGHQGHGGKTGKRQDALDPHDHGSAPADVGAGHGHGAAGGHGGAHHGGVTPGVQASVAAVPVPNEPGPTALKAEMWLLTAAMQEVLVALANNNLPAIPAAIHRVHAAREMTEQSLERGLVKLPRNADKVAEFKQEDAAFHDELVKLVQASRHNDLQAATRQTGVLLNACTQCHLKYRF
ncbi:MAG: cytochrome c [Myxococcota bacterium]